jgi:uncharacterized membrane protein YgcG
MPHTDVVSDSWLDTGHGREPSPLPTVFATTAGEVMARDRLGHGTNRSLRRSTRLLAGVAAWAVVAVGSAGAAWAVRDALFPALGPSAVSVWQNPGRDSQESDVAPTTVALSVATTTSTVPPAAALVAPPSSESATTRSSVDDRDDNDAEGGDRDGGSRPVTSTSVAEVPSGHGEPGETEVDDDGHDGPGVSSIPATTRAPDSDESDEGSVSGRGSGSGAGNDSASGSGSGGSGSGNSGSGSGSGGGSDDD